MKKFPLVLFMTLAGAILCTVHAKDLEKFYLTGYITDGDSNSFKPIDSVEVNVLKDDSIKVPFKILSKPKGDLPNTTTGQLRIIVESGMGNYTLYLNKDGYSPLTKEFKVAAMSEDIKYLDLLTMTKELHRNLEGVTVTSTRLKMVMKGDTLVYDAAAFKLAEGSMLDALVRQLPGASIDDDGVITVNGRKMQELLINGKDFFKGDPKVALQNLPSYAVKDIKVYDKAADDAYLTKSNARISRDEEKESMVMDVTLKKDYNAGWMANAEGGYGTEDRYRARLFAMGYTKNLRVSIFGNANNVGDNETASSDGTWRSSGNTPGISDSQKGGFDYTFDDSKRIRVTGNLTANHQHQKINEIMAVTNLYPTGNIFSRAINMANNRSSSLSTTHSLRYKGDNVFISFTPSLRWNVNNTSSDNRQANFTVNPQENYRGEVIETLFNRHFEGRYSENMLTALRSIRYSHGSSLNMNVSTYATIRPKTWRGTLSIAAAGAYQNSPSNALSVYRQIIGPVGDPDATPQNSDRFSPLHNSNSNFSGSVGYQQDWRRFGEKTTRSINFDVSATYGFRQGRDSTDYYMKNVAGDMSMLPSVTRPADMDHVWANTHYNRTLNNSLTQNLMLTFSTTPSAPGDSTFNAGFYANIYGSITEQNERLRYEKPTILNERVRRPSTLGTGYVQISMMSQNKVRFMSINLFHRISMSAPSLMYLVNTVDDSDPFNVTYGNPAGLHNAITHRTTVSFNRFGRGKHPLNIYWDFHYNTTNNAIAMARSYDPATGISTSRPENIKGNWNIDSYLQIIPVFGSRNQWQIYTVVYGEMHHDVDYLGLNAEPTPSVIRTKHLHNLFKLTYQINKIGSVNFGTTNGIDYVKYPNGNTNNGTTHYHNFSLGSTLSLPLDFSFNTLLEAKLNRGYYDKAMNVTQWLWNASVGKNFIKGKLGVRLSAYDILNSARPISKRATAQTVTERWVNTLPRYVMLTLSYRLDVKPAKGGHSGPSR